MVSKAAHKFTSIPRSLSATAAMSARLDRSSTPA
jgi:hypothetical protein